MDDAIEQLVRDRESGRIDQALASEVLKEALASSQPASTADHGVYWSPSTWKDGFASIPEVQPFNNLIVELYREVSSGENITGERAFITRSDVFEQVDSLQLFVATMAWGYGTTGYGWQRTAKVLQTAGSSGIEAAVNALRTASQQGYEEAFRAWSKKGAAKLPGLGTAFASKLGYFSTYRREEGVRLLIADQYTAWSIWALAGPWDVRQTASKYADYVRLAEHWAEMHECKSDDIERALFRIGRLARNAWRRQHPM